MTLKVDVYDPTNTTLQRTLTGAYGVEFLDDLTIPGFGRFQLDAASTDDVAACVPRRVVRFRTGASAGTGDVFAAIIQDRPAQLTDGMQPEGNLSTLTVECRGLLAWLGYGEGGAVLYPYGGLDGRQQNPRVFGWQTADFDDTGWDEVVTGWSGGALSTAGWPDDQAVAYEPTNAGDRVLYRRTLAAVTGAAGPARMFTVGTVGTRITVWLDGEEVLVKPLGKTGLHYADLPYEELDHQLAVEVQGDGRWGWTWMALETGTDADGNQTVTPGQVLRRTYDPAVFTSVADPWVRWEGEADTWKTAGFDDSGWADPIPDGPLSTAGWPDPDATAFTTQDGRALFRRTMSSSAAIAGATMTVAATYDTSVRVFLDSTQVLYKPPRSRGLFQADVDYPATDAQLAIVVVGGGRFGWTWEQSDGTTIRRTFDPIEFPSATDPWTYRLEAFPGVTVGFVLDTALTEDAARHTRPWSWTFDGTNDTATDPWTVRFSRGFRMQEVGLLLDELTSIEGEAEMTPAGLLRYVVQRGTDKTATVTVDSPFALDLSGRGPTATRWLYETQSGLGTAVDAVAEDTFGAVMERFVQLGSDLGSDAIATVVTSMLSEDSAVKDEISVDLPDDVTPYTDVVLGDTVQCVGRSGTAPVRLTSFSAVQQDTNGHVDWTATGVPV